jgi:hypothetical protein
MRRAASIANQGARHVAGLAAERERADKANRWLRGAAQRRACAQRKIDAPLKAKTALEALREQARVSADKAHAIVQGELLRLLMGYRASFLPRATSAALSECDTTP